jgi:hypothetical protein
MNPVRVKDPSVGDGYSIVLHPRQDFYFSLSEIKGIAEEDRVIIDSDFLYLDRIEHSKAKVVNGKEEVSVQYHVNQKYDLSSWALHSSLFLGEIWVNTAGTYVRSQIYLLSSNEKSRHITTVINPKNSIVKVPINSILHVVLFDSAIDSAEYCYNINKESENFDLQDAGRIVISHSNGSTEAGPTVLINYLTNNLPLLKGRMLSLDGSDKSVPKNECQYFFQVKPKHGFKIDKICDDVYHGGTIEFTGNEKRCLDGQDIMIKDSGFLQLMVPLKFSKSSVEQNKICIKDFTKNALTTKYWDSETRVLVNPNSRDSIEIYEPYLDFTIEISDPSLWFPEVKEIGLKWTASSQLTSIHSVGFPSSFTISSLPDNFCDLSVDNTNKYKISRFRVYVNTHGKVTYRSIFGKVILSCEFNGTTFQREIEVSINAFKRSSYKNRAPRTSGYYNSDQTGSSSYGNHVHTDYLADVKINKISKDDKFLIKKLSDIRAEYTTTSAKTAVSTPAIYNHPVPIDVKKNTKSTTCSATSSTSSARTGNVIHVNPVAVVTPVRMTRDEKIRLVMDDAVSEGPSMWVCNVVQDKTFILQTSLIAYKSDSRFVQEFEFSLNPSYLPISNEWPIFLGGIKFNKGLKTKYVAVHLINNSAIDETVSFNKNGLVSNYLDVADGANAAKFPQIGICKTIENKDVIASNLKHEAGISLDWDSSLTINLPTIKEDSLDLSFANGKWNISLKQYPIPDEVWDKLKDASGVDRLNPWWPEDLLPSSAVRSFTLASPKKYQPLFNEMTELYHDYYGVLNLPIGEIIFRSDIVPQERVVGGTLVKTRQRYVKKLYLYAEYFADQLEVNMPESSDLEVVELNNYTDISNVTLCSNQEYRMSFDDQMNLHPIVMPYWLNLLGVYFTETKRTFVFRVNTSLAPATADDWLIFMSSTGKIVRIKAFLEN